MSYRGKQFRDFVTEIRRGHWKLMTRQEADKLNFGPTKIFTREDTDETLIFLRRSESGGFSISESVIRYYSHRMRNGHCCFVGLFEEDGTNVDHETVLTVERAVKKHDPLPSNKPDWPYYFWLTDKFTVSEPEDLFLQSLTRGEPT